MERTHLQESVNARAGANTWGEQFGKAKGGSCDSITRQSPVALVYNNATYSKLLDNAPLELTDVSDKAELEVENDGLKGNDPQAIDSYEYTTYVLPIPH